jgi:predicted regulator of Ras-like GTPase activity (Roadblock/LC7/MglB family)
MQDILIQLNRVRGVGGSMLVSADGLPIASALREGLDENQLAANVGGMIEHSNTLAERMNMAPVHHLHAASEQGNLLLMSAKNGYLVIIVDPQANLTLMQLELKPFLERITQRLSL